MQKLSERLAPLAGMPPESPQIIPFGEFTPDQPDLGSAAAEATNVIPDARGYRPFPSLIARSTNALDGRALSAISIDNIFNNPERRWLYAGDASALYEAVKNSFQDDDTWNDRSQAPGYSTPIGETWEWAQYKRRIIATNFGDPIQQKILYGQGAAQPPASFDFSDLITSTEKPKARHIATLRQFLVLGNVNTASDGDLPNRVWWSAINDPTDFDPDATTQCDYEDFAEGGAVQRVIGGAEYGVIVQESQITRMEYVGSPTVFAFYPVDRNRGTPIPGSVASFGRDVYYISEEGFFRFNGMQSIPIGVNRVDRYFWDDFPLSNTQYVSAAVDPINKLVIWVYPITEIGTNIRVQTGNIALNGNPPAINAATVLSVPKADIVLAGQIPAINAAGVGAAPENRALIYNWALDKWSVAEFSCRFVFTRSLKEDTVQLAALDTDDKLAYFEGSAIAAAMETGEVQLTLGRRSTVTGVRPLIEGAGAADNTKIVVKTRKRQQDSKSSGAKISLNADGEANLRSDGRYHTFRASLTASSDWDYAQGVEVSYKPTGTR